MNTNRKGFASVILIIVFIIIASGLGYFAMIQKTDTSATSATTNEQTAVQPSQASPKATEMIDRTSPLDSRCTKKAVGIGVCMARFNVVEYNPSAKKCEYVAVNGCNVSAPFNETTYLDSDKELNLCQKVCEGSNI